MGRPKGSKNKPKNTQPQAVATGVVESTAAPAPRKPRTIDELLGTKTNSYRFLKNPFSVDEYRVYLKNLDEQGLFEHALECNLKHSGGESERQNTISNLVEVFKEHAASHGEYLKHNTKPNDTLDQQVKNIVALGK